MLRFSILLALWAVSSGELQLSPPLYLQDFSFPTQVNSSLPASTFPLPPGPNPLPYPLVVRSPLLLDERDRIFPLRSVPSPPPVPLEFSPHLVYGPPSSEPQSEHVSSITSFTKSFPVSAPPTPTLPDLYSPFTTTILRRPVLEISPPLSPVPQFVYNKSPLQLNRLQIPPQVTIHAPELSTLAITKETVPISQGPLLSTLTYSHTPNAVLVLNENRIPQEPLLRSEPVQSIYPLQPPVFVGASIPSLNHDIVHPPALIPEFVTPYSDILPLNQKSSSSILPPDVSLAPYPPADSVSTAALIPEPVVNIIPSVPLLKKAVAQDLLPVFPASIPSPSVLIDKSSASDTSPPPEEVESTTLQISENTETVTPLPPSPPVPKLYYEPSIPDTEYGLPPRVPSVVYGPPQE